MTSDTNYPTCNAEHLWSVPITAWGTTGELGDNSEGGPQIFYGTAVARGMLIGERHYNY